MSAADLITIPLIDTGDRGPLALLDAAPERAEALRRIGERHYTRTGLRLGDAIGRAWLERTANPYREEIATVAARLVRPGGIALNLSYEYACTALTAPDPGGRGARLLRVLDWKLPGLGANVVVAKCGTAAGPYYNVTWPGAVSVLTAMAPGRFSAAIHQAPARRKGLTRLGDELANRIAVWRSAGLPPSHLLRQVFDACPDYAAARRRLIETPIALPAIFVLAGATPGETCIIERLEDRAAVHDGPGCSANHWLTESFGAGWKTRGQDNLRRCAGLYDLLDRPAEGFAWIAPPVLNRDTRLAVRMNAATAELVVIGIEGERPATVEFSLNDKGLEAA